MPFWKVAGYYLTALMWVVFEPEEWAAVGGKAGPEWRQGRMKVKKAITF
jgi:hypothetical protein